MSKTIVVTDRQYEWFYARSRKGRTLAQVIDQVIILVDRVEKDFAKYQTWADASTKTPKKQKML